MVSVPCVPCQVFLGRDVPDFEELLWTAAAFPQDWATPAIHKPQVGLSQEDESDPTPEESDIPERWTADPKFCQAQETNPTLEKVRGQVALREGQEVDPWRGGRWPRVVREDGIWFREVDEGGQRWRQILVPEA